MYKEQKPTQSSSIKREVYCKNIGESPRSHLQEATLTSLDPWFLAPIFLYMFVPFLLCKLASSTRVLVSVFPWFQCERFLCLHMALIGGPQLRSSMTAAQLPTMSPYSEDRQPGSSCIQYLIPLPTTTKFSKVLWHFLLLLSLQRLPASRDLVYNYRYPLLRAILMGQSACGFECCLLSVTPSTP